jgi:hypothetical protein
MWNERNMPQRWYGLLREQMQLEEQRMRVVRGGDIVENDYLEKLLTQVQSLEREMLLVMRQAIAETLAHESRFMHQAPSAPPANSHPPINPSWP